MRRLSAILLLAAAIGLAACGGSDDPSASEPEQNDAPSAQAAETDAVGIESFEFKPQRISVSPGTTVTWTNGDSAVHSIKDKGDLFESDDLSEGGTFEHTYDEAGEFPYICGIHQYMTGTVVVDG